LYKAVGVFRGEGTAVDSREQKTEGERNRKKDITF
jgi:hypothetical protein